jgi:hypothetical protein
MATKKKILKNLAVESITENQKKRDRNQEKAINNLVGIIANNNKNDSLRDKALKDAEETIQITLKNDAENHSVNQDQNVRLNNLEHDLSLFTGAFAKYKKAVRNRYILTVLSFAIFSILASIIL